MRVYSGAPFWLLREGLDTMPLRRPANADIAIVGAGITGALLADTLTGAGFTVTVIDRRAPGEGSTAASTALLLYELDLELLALIELAGEAAAVRAYQMGVEAIAQIEQLVTTLGTPCGFERRGSLYLASRWRDGARLPREADCRNRHGLASTFWSADQVRDTYGLPSHGALYTPTAAVVDPLCLTRALLRRAEGEGATVCPHTTLLDWSSDAQGVELRTTRGTCRAGRVIFATGYEIPPALRRELVALHSSYAIVTQPVDDPGPLRDGCLVWETARPYAYLRSTTDGRLIVGGEDMPFRDPDWRDRLLPTQTRRLERRLRTWVPALAEDAGETAFAWAGTFGESNDGLPFIGPHAGIPRALFALGYGGNGITFGAIAARIIRDLCLGHGHPDAEIYRLDRSGAGPDGVS